MIEDVWALLEKNIQSACTGNNKNNFVQFLANNLNGVKSEL